MMVIAALSCPIIVTDLQASLHSQLALEELADFCNQPNLPYWFGLQSALAHVVRRNHPPKVDRIGPPSEHAIDSTCLFIASIPSLQPNDAWDMLMSQGIWPTFYGDGAVSEWARLVEAFLRLVPDADAKYIQRTLTEFIVTKCPTSGRNAFDEICSSRSFFSTSTINWKWRLDNHPAVLWETLTHIVMRHPDMDLGYHADLYAEACHSEGMKCLNPDTWSDFLNAECSLAERQEICRRLLMISRPLVRGTINTALMLLPKVGPERRQALYDIYDEYTRWIGKIQLTNLERFQPGLPLTQPIAKVMGKRGDNPC